MRTRTLLPAALALALVASLVGGAPATGQTQEGSAGGSENPRVPGEPSYEAPADGRTQAPPTDVEAVAEELTAQAEDAPGGTVQVVVGLDVPVETRTEPTPAADAAQEAGIAVAQEDLAASLEPVPEAEVVGALSSTPAALVEVGPEGLAALAADPNVTSLTPNYGEPVLLNSSAPVVHATEAWAAGFDGAGTTVAVFDSGVDRTHPSFLRGGDNRIVEEGCFSAGGDYTPAGGPTYTYAGTCPAGGTPVDNDGNFGFNTDGVEGTGMAAPCTGGACDHGTHVAGIVSNGTAGSGSNPGIAAGADLWAVQVFSDPPAGGPNTLSFYWDQLGALEYLYEQRAERNLVAINMSLGGGQYSDGCDSSDPTRATIFNQLRAAGIALVVASGNDGYLNNISMPACLTASTSVGAVNAAGNAVMGFSNATPGLDLLAVGDDVFSTVPGGTFANKDGTSMATPIAAAAVAVLREANPALTVSQIETALKSTGTPVIDGGNGLTYPLVNIAAAVTNVAAPPAPTGLTATPGNQSVQLSWTAPAAGSGGPTTSFRVFRNGTQIHETANGSTTSFNVGSLTNGTSYGFQVAAVNAAGQGPKTSTVNATPRTTPGAPTSFTATPGNTQVQLSWAAPSSNGGAAISAYNVYRDNVLVHTTANGSTTTFTNTLLTNGTSYGFKVAAVNAAGEGTQTSVVNATPRTTPGAPTSFTATPGNTQVQLAWSAPASNGGSAITGYRIFKDGVQHGPDLAASATSTTVTGLTNGTSYGFNVAALNAAGQGTQTSTANTTPRTTPGAPTSFTATPGNTQVQLAWAAPASTGGSAITGYRIFKDGVQHGPDLAAGATSTTVTGLTNGTSYGFNVAALNAAGQGTQTSTANTTPNLLPGAPTGLAAAPSNGQVGLSWTAPAPNAGTAVTGYRIYRDGNVIDTIGTTTAYTALGLTNGVEYDFEVAAINAMGDGPKSGAAAATPRTVPDAPSSFSVDGANQQAVLTWAAPSSDGGAAITAYRVFQDGTQVGGDLSPGTTTYTALGLTNGVEYDFEVAAVNVAGQGAKTDVESATPGAVPGAPTGLAATPGNVQVLLTWTAPVDTGGSGIEGYRIYRDGVLVTETDDTDTSFTVSGLTNGVEYDFEVAAVNGTGPGPKSSVVSSTPRTTPGAPTSFTATPGNTQVQLAWAAPASNGGSAITGYRTFKDGVQHGPDLAASATSTTVTGLTNGTSYGFNVAALNAAGQGTQTSTANTTPRTTPGAPTSFTATPGNTQVQLAWAAPSTDGGSAITGYRIFKDGVQHGPDLAAGATSTTVTGLTNGTSYGFNVAALNAAGQGTQTSTANTTPLTTPEAPGNVSLTSGDEQIGVGWTVPTGNGGAPVTGFNIYVDGDLAATTGQVVTHTVTGLFNGSEYDVEVAAVNAAGEGPRSILATATPMPATPTFSDVPFTHQFSKDIEWMASAGITTGFADGTYQPQGTVTRAAMSAFMYRLAGEPAFTPPGTPTFSDVSASHTFFAEIEWMSAEAITTGFAGGLYKPAQAVTRQSMSAFMYRLAGEPAFTPPGTATFLDVAVGSTFFTEIEWMAAEDITDGFPGTLYKPAQDVSRMAMSAFLHRLADGPGVNV